MKVRLKLNESPFGPSLLAVEMAKKYAEFSNLYDVEDLREALIKELARYSGVDEEKIELFSGSSHALSLLFIYAKASNTPITMPFPTFHVLYGLADAYKIDIRDVPLKGKEFLLDEEKLLALSEGSIVYISNPNNPTSNMLIENEDLLVRLSKRAKLVILDEAYYEFSGKTFSNLTFELENLIIIRTLSKAFNIAGARVGYTISSKEAKQLLNSLRIGYEVPVVSQALALGAIRDIDTMKKTVSYIIRVREETMKRLLDNGIHTIPSFTNFLYLELPYECMKVKEALDENGFEVFCLSEVSRFKRSFERSMRVSVGREEDMERFLEKLAFGQNIFKSFEKRN